MKLSGENMRRTRVREDALVAGAFLIYGALVPGLTVILLPVIVVEAGHRPFRIGAIVAALSAGSLFSPMWGWIADRMRASVVPLPLGFAFVGMGLMLLADATRLGPLFLASFLIGLGGAGCAAVGVLRAARNAGPSQTAAGISRLQMWTAIGAVAGMAAAGVVPARLAVLIGSLSAAIAALLVVLAGGGEQSVDTNAIRRVAGRSDTAALLIRLVAAWSVFSLAVSTFSSLYPVVMRRSFDIHLTASSDTIATATLLSLPLYLVGGRLVRHIGGASCLRVCFVTRTASLLAFAVLALVRQHRTGALVVAGLFQFIWPLVAIAANDMAATLPLASPGLSIGILAGAGALSSVLGSLLSGLVADWFGYRFVGVAAAALSLVVLFIRLEPARRRSAARLAGDS